MVTCCSVPFATETSLAEHLWSPYLHTRGPHRCSTCGATFASKSAVDHHDQDGFHIYPPVHPLYYYRCTVCTKGFHDRSELDHHMDTMVHNIPCRWCDKVCHNRFGYDVHLSLDHPDMLKQHPETNYTESLVQNPVVTQMLSCVGCGIKLCFQESWEYHMSNSHPDLPRAPTVAPADTCYCITCRRGFFCQRALDQHCAAVHPPLSTADGQSPARPPVPCPDCGGLFYTQQAVELHQSDIHVLPAQPGRRRKPASRSQISCAECGSLFASQHALGQHTVAAHSFASSSHQQDLVRAPHAAAYCTICARQFLSAKAVEQHISAVHPAVPRGRRPTSTALAAIPCQHCNAFFQTALALSQHTSTAHAAASRTRTPIAQFSCTICSKVFQSEYAVDQHMVSAAHPEVVQKGRSRRNAPVYRCEECSRVFEAKDMLTLHAAEHVAQRLRLG